MSHVDPNEAELHALIEQFQASGLRELHARCGDFEIYLSTDPDAPGLDGAPAVKVSAASRAAAPARTARAAAAAPTAGAAPAAVADPGDWPEGAVIVQAPYMGTFYRAPKPGAPPYVEIGSAVTAETELCLVEVMKLFTAVRAPAAGTVHAVLAEDGQMVQADQPIFVLLPA
jgi:acetyl-CoA carboxylase biotin carboxyl carrier protein